MPSKVDGSPLLKEIVARIREEQDAEVRERREYDRQMARLLPWLVAMMFGMALYWAMVTRFS